MKPPATPGPLSLPPKIVVHVSSDPDCPPGWECVAHFRIGPPNVPGGPYWPVFVHDADPVRVQEKAEAYWAKEQADVARLRAARSAGGAKSKRGSAAKAAEPEPEDEELDAAMFG